MLEEMRQTRFARCFVGGTDLVPDHLRHHRGAVILDHHHLKSVSQRKAGWWLRGRCGLGEADGCGRYDCRGKRNEGGRDEAISGHQDLYDEAIADMRKCVRSIVYGAAGVECHEIGRRLLRSWLRQAP